MKLFIATNNSHKLREIASILQHYGIDCLKPEPGNFPEVEETGRDLRENAILKARAGYEFSGIPSIADDTGLEVDYLDGAPGVYSARFAGENCSYDENNRKLLKMLEGVPYEKRTARFKTVIALVLNSDNVKTVEGQVEGNILEESRGRKGFGYDPIFYFAPKKKTFAELDADEKNSLSHRARALKELEKLLDSGVFK